MSTKITVAEAKRQDRADAITELREILPAGTEVLTVLRSVSRSGMSRSIGVMVVRDGELRSITHLVARGLGWGLDYGFADGIKVRGCGMDMGFHLVYSLSQTLYGAQDRGGYQLSQRWV